jgi:type IV pilus assembly protein PilM
VLQLTRQKKKGGVVGIDIDAGSVAAAGVEGSGDGERLSAGVSPLPPGAFHEGEVVDADGVASTLKELFAEHKLSKRVRVGIGNQRVVVRTMRLPAIEDPKELDAAVRFQAQEQMPMPLDQAVLEHQVVGGVPAEEGAKPQIDVVVVAARREMVAAAIEPVRRAGLEPVGVDLSAFGMIRALAGVGAPAAVDEEDGGQQARGPRTETVLYCNVGDIMNLAVARGRACLFTRISTVGMEGIAARLGSGVGLNPDHAAQWMTHVGLEQPPEAIEGDPAIVAAVREALEQGVTGLGDELRLSLDYYGAQEGAVPVERVVLCGPGSAVPGLAAGMETDLGLSTSVSRPPALAGYGEDVAARLTLPYGLALEN